MPDSVSAQPVATVRLDVWLDVACLFKTRGDAQRACRGGKVAIDGQPAKPHKLLHTGEEIRITRGAGRRQIVRVLGLEQNHVAKADARMLYEDKTPPPTPDELERRAFERAFPRPAGAPDKRTRRKLRRLKGIVD